MRSKCGSGKGVRISGWRGREGGLKFLGSFSGILGWPHYGLNFPKQRLLLFPMSTYSDVTCHIVFATKNRIPALRKERRDDLYRFIWGLLKERKCHLYRIGGVEDHVHLLTSLHSSIALASLVKEVKTASSVWIKGEKAFPVFEHWQDGYGAFSVAAKDRPGLIDYIRNQEEHHRVRSFVDELKEIAENAHLEWKPDYLP